MPYNYYDSPTRANLSGNALATESAAAVKKMIFAGSLSTIYLTSNNNIAINAGGTFDHYATVEDRLTDIPMTSDNRVIDVDRLNAYLSRYDYRVT